MKQSDSLELVNPGSLERPGPVGRVLRLTLGLVCLYALYRIVIISEAIIATPASLLPSIAILFLAAVFIFNYVVNIGFGKSWRYWPLVTLLAVLGSMAVVGQVYFGSFDNPAFGISLWIWLAYFYAHLGVSFVLAAVIATPGCEMRAIPELFGRIMGRPVAEHHCPASLITNVDSWEHRRRVEHGQP